MTLALLDPARPPSVVAGWEGELCCHSRKWECFVCALVGSLFKKIIPTYLHHHCDGALTIEKVFSPRIYFLAKRPATLGWKGGGSRLRPLYTYCLILRRRAESAAASFYAACAHREGKFEPTWTFLLRTSVNAVDWLIRQRFAHLWACA